MVSRLNASSGGRGGGGVWMVGEENVTMITKSTVRQSATVPAAVAMRGVTVTGGTIARSFAAASRNISISICAKKK